MTKVTILGQAEAVEPKKKIEFVHYMDSFNGTINEANVSPSCYSFIELITRGTEIDNMDVMFAYDNSRNDKGATIYLGYFNDGTV